MGLSSFDQMLTNVRQVAAPASAVVRQANDPLADLPYEGPHCGQDPTTQETRIRSAELMAQIKAVNALNPETLPPAVTDQYAQTYTKCQKRGGLKKDICQTSALNKFAGSGNPWVRDGFSGECQQAAEREYQELLRIQEKNKVIQAETIVNTTLLGINPASSDKNGGAVDSLPPDLNPQRSNAWLWVALAGFVVGIVFLVRAIRKS